MLVVVVRVLGSVGASPRQLNAIAKQDEHSALEVQIYCEETGNIYVHHDIALPALPLCLAWMDMPPRTPAMSTASGSADEGHTVG